MGRIALGENEDHGTDADEGGELDDRQDVLQVGPGPRAQVIDDRQEEDEKDADGFLGQGRQGHEMGQVFRGESHGQRGDGPRIDDQEERPAEKKRKKGPEGFAEIDVRPARLGHGRGQFGERNGAEETQHPADHPDGQDEKGRLDAGGDAGGDEEDPGPDDAADDDSDNVPKSEHASEVLTLFLHAR